MLFVCEKRAAIDVVFHRLRQQGLDELCCLIHDSQTDKKAFIQNLKQTYEKFLSQADLDPDKEALLEKLLGQDYEVITADDRLDKIATDFVEHCATRWESGKSMLVCIDKITCGRMWQRIVPLWQAKLAAVKAVIPAKEAELTALVEESIRDKAVKSLAFLRGLLEQNGRPLLSYSATIKLRPRS